MRVTAYPAAGLSGTLLGLVFGICPQGQLTAQTTVVPVSGDATQTPSGRLFQIIDAVPLRGEEIRLRVALRVNDSGESSCSPRDVEPNEVVAASEDCGSSAFGWLRIDGQPAAGPGTEHRTGRVAASQWSVEDVITRVPDDALDLSFGILLDGDGPMWADDIQLAVHRPDGVWRRLFISNADCESVASGGRPAAWGGIDPAWDARIDREVAYEGSSAIRIARVRPDPATE
ncbi:MAG: hypothetical protein ACWGON_06045 [Gemmatimonadota bacterium]